MYILSRCGGIVIDTDIYKKIRDNRNAGLSKSKTARDLGISRDTVRKYWDGRYIPGVSEQRDLIESPQKTEIKEAIKQYCKDHMDDETSKQKINGKILWRDLHYEYPRSKATFRRYWAEIRGDLQVETRLPLLFGIAEMAQGDWKQAYVRVNGRKIKGHVFCLTLMYGYTPFKKFYPNEKQMNLIDGLVSAFEAFQGIPKVIFFGNYSVAVKTNFLKLVKTENFWKGHC
jgi:transposase